jgi:signal transduction histidine kinase
MAPSDRAASPLERAELAVRLHDIGAGLSVSIGLLKASRASSGAGPQRGRQAIAALEDVLSDLQRLTSATANSVRNRPTDVQASLEGEARRLGIQLELEVVGDLGWLPLNQAELVEHVGREALRNVARHSGTNTCRISLDLSSCPFTVRARDWGAGLQAAARSGNGIELSQRLAGMMGCELAIRSQPGMGTELVLRGPACARERQIPASTLPAESESHRKDAIRRRPAARRRSFGESSQQIK